jgi:fatty acid desaturase
MELAAPRNDLRAHDQACLVDRRVGAWLLPALLDWQWISIAMTLSLLAFTHLSSWFLKVPVFALGMWAVGVCIHRLAMLGHDAGHRTVCRTPWLNDALAVFFVLWPMLISLDAWRVYHNEGHHPRRNTGTLGDPEIVFKRIDGSWSLPLSPRRMWRDIGLSLCGAMIPGALIFVISMATPRCQVRTCQALTKVLARFKGEQADIHPLRFRDVPNTPLAIAADLLAGIALIAGRFTLTAAFAYGVTWAMGVQHLAWHVVAMFYGGYVTSFWTVFRLRGYCEHVGGYTISLAEPSWWLRALVFPHAGWAHQLHHEMPGLPFHRYKDVLRARQAQGVSVLDVFALFASAPPLVSGELMPPEDPRSVMARATAQGRLRPAVAPIATLASGPAPEPRA